MMTKKDFVSLEDVISAYRSCKHLHCLADFLEDLGRVQAERGKGAKGHEHDIGGLRYNDD